MSITKKEFNVPPVIFPSGGNPTPDAISSAQSRQSHGVPTAAFQPPRPANAGIPFMSFDIGAASTSGPIGGGGGESSGANFDEEEPLLDELGIHPNQIWLKTKSILNPFRVNSTVHKESDLSGPIFLYLSLCLFQLLSGKIQLGVILGWIVVSSIFLYVVFNMLAGRNGNLNLHTCTSVIGYCLLPVVVFSAVSLFVPQGGPFRFVIGGVFVVWATRSCTNLMVAVADGGEEHRRLIASRKQEPPMASAVPTAEPAGATSLILLPDVEDEEDDLFEIDLEAVNISPAQYSWESYFNCNR